MLKCKVAIHFEKFSTIPKVHAQRIEALAKRYYHYPGIVNYDPLLGSLDILLICDENVEKHIAKFDIALKALKSPNKPFLSLMDPIYHSEIGRASCRERV